MKTFTRNSKWFLVNDQQETIALSIHHYTQPKINQWYINFLDAQGNEYITFADCNKPDGTFFPAYSTAPATVSEESLESLLGSIFE